MSREVEQNDTCKVMCGLARTRRIIFFVGTKLAFASFMLNSINSNQISTSTHLKKVSFSFHLN